MSAPHATPTTGGHDALAGARDALRQVLPPELGLLVSRGRPAELDRFAAAADWGLAIAAGKQHRLLGHLAATVDEADLGRYVPPSELATLRREPPRRRRWFDQRVLPQLAELAEAFGRAGTIPVLLKGAALVGAGTVPAGERPMGDLDVLVRADEVATASAVLHDLGYRDRVSTTQRRWAREHHYQDPPRYHPDRPLTVELHWDLQTARHRLAFDPASLHTVELTLPGGHRVRRLDDVDQLTHLCLHFWRDRRAGTGPPLGQLWDVHRAAATLTPAQWATLRSRAVARGHLEVVAAVLACDLLLLPHVPTTRLVEADAIAGDPRLEAFVRQRVLAGRPAAVQLIAVTDEVASSPYRMLTRVLAELRRPYARLVPLHGDGPGWRLRLRHARRVGGLVGELLRSPRTSWAEIRLDRWAHGLQ